MIKKDNTQENNLTIHDLLTTNDLSYSFSKVGGIIVIGKFLDEYIPENKGNVQFTINLLTEKCKALGIQNPQIEEARTDNGRTTYIYIYADTVARIILSLLNK
ncbi:MAG: hypothetical protein SOV21_03605 [Methanosphaera sp.]|nr:hypothetical protein [Methanosphaera sp.]